MSQVHLVRDANSLKEQISASLARAEELQALAQASSTDKENLVESFLSWHGRNKLLLRSSFTTSGIMTATPLTEYENFAGLKVAMIELVPDASVDDVLADLKTRCGRLRRLIENLDLYDTSPAQGPTDASASTNPKVFLVHGHDVAAIGQVELVLRRACDVEVVILADQASRGQTVIEKLEQHLGDQSSFAVVLMTGDDLGHSASAETEQLRARQNVIFELGYALAALGRSRVVALYQEGVEIPSDFAGVTYIAFGNELSWQQSLVRELRAAGMIADANRL